MKRELLLNARTSIIKVILFLCTMVISFTFVSAEASEPVSWSETNATITELGQTSLKVEWESADLFMSVSSYEVYENGEFVTSLSSSQLSYDALGLESNREYYYVIYAKDINGDMTDSGPKSPTVTTNNELYRRAVFKNNSITEIVRSLDQDGDYKTLDNEGLSYLIATQPSHGTAIINSTSGEYTYTPHTNYIGSDTFVVKTVGDIDYYTTINLYVDDTDKVFNVSEESNYAYPDSSGIMRYTPDSNGNIIPDFSMVGYNSGTSTPTTTQIITLNPSEDETIDSTSRIQAAIDTVSTYSPDSNGVRGAVLLKKGLYTVSDTINLNTSGVILLGEGSGTDGTVLIADRQEQYTVINVEGTGEISEVIGTRVDISDTYVPVGAFSFNISDPSAYEVGDNIVVYRPSTQGWIDAIGMGDLWLSYDYIVNWAPGDYDFYYERTIVSINQNEITIDAPIVEAIDNQYGGGQIYKYTHTGRINTIGIENLRIESLYSSNVDEQHGWTAVRIDIAEDSWVKNVTSRFFGFATVNLELNTKNITVDDGKYLDGVSIIGGGRRYAFNNNGSLNLFRDLYASYSRHPFVQGSRVEGPNAFINGYATDTLNAAEPHMRYSTGLLYDNIDVQGEFGTLGAINRGNSGSGHGWSGNSVVFWNSQSNLGFIMSPPTGRNYGIGVPGQYLEPGVTDGIINFYHDWHEKRTGDQYTYSGSAYIGNGTFDVLNGPATTSSLYNEQYEDRYGVYPDIFDTHEKIESNMLETNRIVMTEKTTKHLEVFNRETGLSVEGYSWISLNEGVVIVSGNMIKAKTLGDAYLVGTKGADEIFARVSVEEVLYTEDFEASSIGGEPDSWSVSSVGGEVIIASDQSDNYLSIVDDSLAYRVSATKGLSCKERYISLDFDIKIDDFGTSYIRLLDDGAYVMMIKATSSGYLIYYSVNEDGSYEYVSFGTYELGRWYNISLDIDLVESKTNISIDGISVGTNKNLYVSNASSFDTFGLYTLSSDTTSIAIDNIILDDYDPIYQESFEFYNIGETPSDWNTSTAGGQVDIDSSINQYLSIVDQSTTGLVTTKKVLDHIGQSFEIKMNLTFEDSGISYIKLLDDSSVSVMIKADGSRLLYYLPGGGVGILYNYSVGDQIQLVFEIDAEGNRVNVYANNTLIGADLGMYNYNNSINIIGYYSTTSGSVRLQVDDIFIDTLAGGISTQ